MSCTTQNQQAIRFIVSMGALPEGFCGTPQELADAIAARLIISSNPFSSSFAIGSIPPSSNVGPWLKDCATWFVWDDNLATYVPMQFSTSFPNYQVISTTQTFTVPANVYYIKAQVWGAGGGGGNNAGAIGGGGGGSGSFGESTFSVLPAQVINVIVGTGGAAGAPGGTGGASTILTMSAGGGVGGLGGSGDGGDGGDGGAPTGAGIPINGSAGEDSDCILGQGLGGAGGGAPAGGGGGKSGGVQAHAVGVVPGGGGAGGANAKNTGGAGAAGRVIIYY